MAKGKRNSKVQRLRSPPGSRDRVRDGDAFFGGFLFGYLRDGPAAGVRYGVAISSLKQTNPGDLCWATREEVERILDGGNLRIVR